MCGQAILLSVVLLMTATWTLADNVEIKLGIIIYMNNSVSCVQSKDNLKEFETTILENEMFALITNISNIDNITCFEYRREEIKFVNNIKYDRQNVSVLAKKEMGVLWQCKFELFKHISSQKPLTTNCYIKVHVRLEEPPHTLLVNRVVLPTMRNPLVGRDQIVDRTAIYNYTEGEQVDVFCANLNDMCGDIGLTYDYAAKLDDIFNTTMKQQYGAGLRIKLQAQHNGSTVTCKCHSSGNEDVIQLTFVLKRQCDHIANIKINGLIASPLFEHSDVWVDRTKQYNINYKALKTENTNIVGYVLKDDVQLRHDINNCKTDKEPEINNTWIDIKMRQNQFCSLNINAFKQTTGTMLEKIAIKISQLPERFIDNTALVMIFSNYTPVMEMYEYKHKRLLYYEYEEDQNVTLTCSKPKPQGVVTCIDFNGTVHKEHNSYSKDLTLTSADNQTYFTCKFNLCSEGKLEDDLDYSRSVKVVFRKIIQVVSSTSAPTEETTLPTADTDKPSKNPKKDTSVMSDVTNGETNEQLRQSLYIVAPIIAVLCIFLCVFIVIYKRRKEHMACAPRDPNYENLQCHSEYQIPAHPPQWSRNQHREEVNYHVPLDLRKDEVVYAQPVAEDPYATPIPKSLRPNKAKKVAHEPTYAELDLPSSSAQAKLSEGTEYATVGEMYSKVVPKSERNKQQNLYGNHFPNSPYVNSETTEYIEPTYCQPHLLK